MDYSESPTNGEDNVRLLVDMETGEVFRVVHINDKGKYTETLVVAGLDVKDSSHASETRTPKRRAAKPSFARFQFEAIRLIKKDTPTKNELKVLMFLLENMGYMNQVQVTHTVIGENVGIARETVSKAIKSLKAQDYIVERQNEFIPGLPVYAINPGMFFCGSDEARSAASARFHKDLKKASDAKRPKLTVVK